MLCLTANTRLANDNQEEKKEMRRNGVLTIEAERFGHLPVPGFAKGPVAGYFAGVFADITQEKRVVSSLRSVALEETRADLVLGP